MSTTSPQPRPTLASHENRLTSAEQRLDEHEARLDKYDAIIVRLDVLIDVLTKHVDQIAQKADTAIESQGVLKERDTGTHRWATLAWSAATGIIVGVVGLLVGHAFR